MDTGGGNGLTGRQDAAEDPGARWRRLVRDQEASGSGVREFCRDRGVSEHGFYVWRRRLRDAALVAAAPRPRRRARFVPVRVTAHGSDRVAPLAAPAIEVQFPTGHVLRVARDIDAAALARLVAALDARAC